MTKRHYRQRRPKTITTYGVHVLDNSREEVMPRYHRDAEPGDPWLSPVPNKSGASKSDALTAVLILIAHAERNSLPLQNTGTADNYEYDLRDFCAMACLTERQAEVVLMVGEGSTVTQIAATLGISHQAVSIRLHKGRRRLIQAVLPIDPINHLPRAEGLRKVYSIGGETRPVPA